MSHDLKTATIVPASKGIGESDFDAARAAIAAKYGVQPVEVFLDSVQTEGIVTAGDLQLDLTALNLRYLGFGADASEQPAPADAAAPVEAPAEPAELVDSSVTSTLD